MVVVLVPNAFQQLGHICLLALYLLWSSWQLNIFKAISSYNHCLISQNRNHPNNNYFSSIIMGRPSALLKCRGNQHQQESKELPFSTLAFPSMCCCHILWEFHSFVVEWSLDRNHHLCWALHGPE